MKLFSLVLLAIFLVGCGSAPENAGNGNGGRNDSANSNSRPGVVANGNSTSQTSGTPDMAGIPADPNVSQGDGNTAPAGNIAATARGRVLAEGPPPPPGSKPPAVGAGDNSSVSSEMLKDGSILERRVFSNNEYLNVLEVRTKGKDRTARVVLKNGKSVQLPADRIGCITDQSAATLLEMAGIKPKAMAPQAGTSAKPR